MKRNEVCDAAKHEICNNKQDCYGNPEDNFLQIAEIWTSVINHKLVQNIAPYDVALMMAGLKLARASGDNPFKLDTCIDGCGYFAIAGELGNG